MKSHVTGTWSSLGIVVSGICALVLLMLTLQIEGTSASYLHNSHKDHALWKSKGHHLSTPRHEKDSNLKEYSNHHNSVHGGRRSHKRFKKEMTPEEQERCHQTALWKCGNSFLDMFGMLSNLSEEDAFEPRCALRSAFYSCMKSLRSKPCKRFHKVRQSFREKVGEALWVTRNCLPGLH